MLSTIGRIIWVPIAFLLSVMVCAFVIVTLGMERFTHYMNGFNDPDITVEGSLQFFGNALVLTQAVTIVPAVLGVLIGEIARIRTVYYYVVVAGLSAVAAPVVASLGAGGAAVMPATIVWQVCATGGFIGGFVYWLLAGRSA